MNRWKNLYTIGMLVAITMLTAACEQKPPRPELIQVAVKNGRTHINLQLNAGYISPKSIQQFHTDYVEVDGTIIEEDWFCFPFSQDGEVRIKLPMRAENQTTIQAKNHIKLSGLLLLNFRKYRFVCSISKFQANWRINEITIEETADVDALAISTLKSIYSAQQQYSQKFNSLADLAVLSNTSMVDSKVADAASRGYGKDGYIYNLAIEGKNWYCTAIPKHQGYTGSRPYRIDQAGAMYFLHRDQTSPQGKESWRVLPPNDTQHR